LVERQLVLLEFAYGERGAVNGQGRSDDIDARAVWKARIADRRGLVDTTANLADDTLADIQQLLVVAEPYAGLLNLTVDLNVDLPGAVDHDIGDIVARQERFQRAITQNVVADIVEQFLLLDDRHCEVLDRNDVVDDLAHFLASALGVELGKL